MKLQQLRYALEVYRHNLNVSEAADALFTSQPGISKQIRLLEEELGIQIFIRSGKRVVSVSQPGKAVLEISERILRDVQNIKNIGSEFTDHDSGSLTIDDNAYPGALCFAQNRCGICQKLPQGQFDHQTRQPFCHCANGQQRRSGFGNYYRTH